MKLTQKPFGSLADGREVILFTIANDHGYALQTMNYGATITGLLAPDRNGHVANVTLGYDSFERYRAGHPFFGSTVGRVCNRIGGARFTLDDQEYLLPANEGANILHGGKGGFHVRLWTAQPFEREGQAGVIYHLVSPDGDQGFPGEVAATVSHSLTDENEILMEYSAESSAATPLDLTNHAYWNLAGAPDRATDPAQARRTRSGAGGAIGDHVLEIHGSEYLELDPESIPTGKLISVEGTAWDFRSAKPVGQDVGTAGGYDHCYVLHSGPGEFGLAAAVTDPASGRTMSVHTTSPAVQFYTGNKLPKTTDGAGNPFYKHDALCLETQFYPNAVNRPGFPAIILRPGESWSHRTVHRFGIA